MTEREDVKLERLVLVVIANLAEVFQRVQNELNEVFQRVQSELTQLKSELLVKAEQLDKTTLEYGGTMRKEAKKEEADAKSAPLKLTLVGYGAVGKTTIFRLLKGAETPQSYFPTIGANVDCEDLKIGNNRINVWDLAGQEHYHRTWPIFLRNTKIALIVTDSTEENVERTKNILNIVKSIEPKAITIGIANKQDLPNALPPKEVESILGIKTHPCVAIDTSYREAMITVIEDTIAEIRRHE